MFRRLKLAIYRTRIEGMTSHLVELYHDVPRATADKVALAAVNLAIGGDSLLADLYDDGVRACDVATLIFGGIESMIQDEVRRYA